MNTPYQTVFLLDVDNTLLDNDHVERDLRAHLSHEFGTKQAEDYWGIFENLRQEMGYADYLGALQRYRLEHPHHPHILRMSSFLIGYPFQERLYLGALEVIHRLRQLGPCVILSDGDVVFQPHKIERSGILEAVGGHALIYIHKEQELDDVERRYPAQHYVLVDDKLRILTAVKAIWGERLTTVFPRQGHYALDLQAIAGYPSADLSIERIGDLLEMNLEDLGQASKS
ncbi:MAG: HAD family hydrolase [Thermaceae bacterium]|nr:HAD family hydrolase [Thermaceae bacterium]